MKGHSLLLVHHVRTWRHNARNESNNIAAYLSSGSSSGFLLALYLHVFRPFFSWGPRRRFADSPRRLSSLNPRPMCFWCLDSSHVSVFFSARKERYCDFFVLEYQKEVCRQTRISSYVARIVIRVHAFFYLFVYVLRYDVDVLNSMIIVWCDVILFCFI